ncbi:assimilatory sulfite reductase (NADPH) flavoprotein subunit [Pseudomarimonas arenosa]|uniref:Sulfite reductase [NADPH] flavoprotein alpha-component n=1 Tax=Pseudomarimonas arenosa TaxID=2774145 RepID=A0AAW3ZGD9_9GAMM|nr:assimilatory sulfite reductase (NADPH) flavoprotein subunit [Pseudomarimonas arenosa]MBD8524217.1 assimilatory sulfite reductase (NADPH) flavoprotein subunit [Pseudomarimonas arenosa]
MGRAMSALPRLPELLPAENAEALSRAVAGLEPTALWWLSGYAAGLAHARGTAAAGLPLPAAVAEPSAVSEAVPSQRLTVIYGSQTGNAKRAAEALAADAEAAGLSVRLLRADAYPLRELKDERLLSVVISTQGEGDPPDDAQGFVEFLLGRRAPELKQLQFSVLGLGDSSYAKFCEIGKQIDARLLALGAKRLNDRADADIDIETVAAPWRAGLLQKLRELNSTQSSAPTKATVTPLRRAVASSAYGRDNPFAAELLAQQRISGRDSEKDVRHIELDLAGSGLSYEPGDALGVWADNPPSLVAAVLEATALDGATEVEVGGKKRLLSEWLSQQREITRGARSVFSALAERRDDHHLRALLADNDKAAQLVAQTPLIDALHRWPAEWTAESLVQSLRPMTPRLYSIASSRAEVGEEAHLTVDVLRYALGDRIHLGAASSHLARSEEGQKLKVFIEANERFRLPADGQRDLIMIGAGTGIAPYRGFLQQRVADGGSGRHWLVFGAQRFASDFLYQAEWLQARQRGHLQKIDLAFSRDQAERIYVQRRLREQGRELYAWLESGAHLYICGAIAMGKDVHQALRDVLIDHGGRSPDAADDYLRQLQQAGRYHKDVY